MTVPQFSSLCVLQGWLYIVHPPLANTGFQRTLVAHSVWHGTKISIITLEKMTQHTYCFVSNSVMASTGKKSQNYYQRSYLRGRLEEFLSSRNHFLISRDIFTRFCPYVKHLSMFKTSLTVPKVTILKAQNVRTGNSLERRMGENDYLFSTNPVPETIRCFIMITIPFYYIEEI